MHGVGLLCSFMGLLLNLLVTAWLWLRLASTCIPLVLHIIQQFFNAIFILRKAYTKVNYRSYFPLQCYVYMYSFRFDLANQTAVLSYASETKTNSNKICCLLPLK
jgi:hypothetical protein